MVTILMPLPARDFDPSEAAVTWQVLRGAGHTVVFATESGRVAQGDLIMYTGRGLDPWGRYPYVRRVLLVGLFLRADRRGRAAYRNMVQSEEFQNPITWSAIAAQDFGGIVLTGGHRARGMRAYVESVMLQHIIADFFAAMKPVAAICHGVLLVARSKRSDGQSVLSGYKTTTLTWDQESLADRIAHVVRWWDPGYYRTYTESAVEPKGYMSVEQEVVRALAHVSDFLRVPRSAAHYLRKTLGLFRDTPTDNRPAWIVKDRNYVSARWPGDVHTFAKTFESMLPEV